MLNNPEILCKWLSFSVMETRQTSGKVYPPKKLYALLCGLLRMACNKGCTLNFLDKEDQRFMALHKRTDNICSQLHSIGIGVERNSAARW